MNKIVFLAIGFILICGACTPLRSEYWIRDKTTKEQLAWDRYDCQYRASLVTGAAADPLDFSKGVNAYYEEKRCMEAKGYVFMKNR